MPLYEYVCEPNGHRFEVRHGMNEPPPEGCPECKGPIRRVIQPVGIMFKGSGFYKTDSRQTTAKPAVETKGDKPGDESTDVKPAADSAATPAPAADTSKAE